MTNRGKKMSTAGAFTTLWGWDKLKPNQLVWVCEGEWDGMVLSWLLNMAKVSNECVVAVPGAKSLKSEWSDALKGCDVIVAGDNDEDGSVMAKKFTNAITGSGGSVSYIGWPDTFPDKYDLSDFVAERYTGGDMKARKILDELRALITDRHPQESEWGEKLERLKSRHNREARIRRAERRCDYS